MVSESKRNVLFGSLLVLFPVATFFGMKFTASEGNGYWETYVWILQPLIFIALPLGTGTLIYEWLTYKGKFELARYIRMMTYVVAGLLGASAIAPNILKVVHEQKMRMNPPTYEMISSVVNPYYQRIVPGMKMGKVNEMNPYDTNWVVSADVCAKNNSNEFCVPVVIVISENGRVLDSTFDINRLKTTLEKMKEQQK